MQKGFKVMAHDTTMWAKARTLFEMGKSLEYIVAQTGISKGQISKKSKAERWEKETEKKHLKNNIIGYEEEKGNLERKKETLITSLSMLNDSELQIISDVVENETGKKSLIFSNAIIGAMRINQRLQRDTKQTVIKLKQYDKGQVCGEYTETVEIELEPKDIKELMEANDKSAITANIAQRHANTTINNTNANQNNFTPSEISKAIADGLPD